MAKPWTWGSPSPGIPFEAQDYMEGAIWFTSVSRTLPNGLDDPIADGVQEEFCMFAVGGGHPERAA